jgi:hypothetical protein
VDFDGVRFGAGIEADRATSASRSCIPNEFDAFQVELSRRLDAFLGTGVNAAHATLAFLLVETGGRQFRHDGVGQHADRILHSDIKSKYVSRFLDRLSKKWNFSTSFDKQRRMNSASFKNSLNFYLFELY